MRGVDGARFIQGDGVIAPLGKGVAAEDSGGGEEGAPDGAMDAVCLECVSGAGGGVSALATDEGGEGESVEPDDGEEGEAEGAGDGARGWVVGCGWWSVRHGRLAW